MASDTEIEDNDAWDEEVMLDLRRFAIEQALAAHLGKRDTAVDLSAVFRDADRIVNYCVGHLTP